MDEKFKLYPNGFIFSKDKQDNIPDYYSLNYILNSYKYYYDPKYGDNTLEIEDKFIILHGHFIFIEPHTHEIYDKNKLLSTLLEKYFNQYEKFLDMLDFLGGRYCVIVGNTLDFEVFQDASGARSFYYAVDNEIVSSHANLINDNIECQPYILGIKTTYPRFSFHNSPFENVKSLVPNFKYTHSAKDIFRFFPRANNKYKKLADSEKVKVIEKLWKRQLVYYKNNYNNLLISLTGGNDSRISLALSKEYKEEIKFFTYCKKPETVNPSIKREVVNETDRTIVRKMLADIDINHSFIYYDDEDLEIPQKLNYTLSKNSIAKHGRFLLNLYLLNFPQHNIMHLRGTCLEIVQSVYVNPNIESNNSSSVLKRYLHTAEKFYNLLPKEEFTKIGNEGIQKLGYNQKQFDFHLLDLYYWEHRMGRWHPELLNETDTAFDTFLPFNIRAILEIGMAFDIEKRQSGYLFKELINNNFPILNFYGVNSKKNIYEQHKKTINGLSKITPKAADITKFFNNFTVYDSESNMTHKIKTSKNIIKIPLKYLNRDNYSFFTYKYKHRKGLLKLSINSPYSNDNAEGFIKYQVLVNEVEVLEEDMSKWHLNNDINLFNLSQNDIITIKVITSKNLTRLSWERATRLEIVNIEEHTLNENNYIEEKLTCTSPYSSILI